MFAPVEQEKHEIFVLVMALNISSKSKSTHGANYFNNGSPTDYCDKPVMKPSLVITFARALFKPEVVWGSFLSSSPSEDILALCLEKGSYYCVDIRFQHR